MLIYFFIDFMVILLGILFGKNLCFYFDGSKKKNVCKKGTRFTINNSLIFYLLIFCILFIVSAFRGDFATDYNGYIEIYDRYSNYTLQNILQKDFFSSNPEIGFLIFQFIVKKIFNNKIYIFIVTSLIIVYAHLKEISNHFLFGIIPILLFINLGNYYISFNLLRQVFAASIVLLGSKYLYSKNMLHYFIIVAIAITVHTSAIFMIPAYFFLTIDFKRKGMLLLIIITAVLSLFLPDIIDFTQNYYWDWYSTDSYGMTGYSIKNAIVPVLISVVTIVNTFYVFTENGVKKSSIKNNNVNTVWLNSTYLYLILNLLSLRVMMLSRFTVFFSTYVFMLFASNIQMKYKNNYYKYLIIILIISCLIVYGFLVKYNSLYNPFYFIWE